ncbi:hypothetical protein CDN99_00350 [Roseateles aquatilis]|uniref:SlyX protein n=1 Tax=Roseateles aquatilis TaxID=431061 RepID=A0A246JMV5_9BURK|nr:SlyX family protein [Roseateles aquatilis]OWQ93880.1 hypothetical protein CDN99_00350 [Roseateles aquatilis]
MTAIDSSQAPDAAPTVHQLEARITELEIKASFAEDLMDHLNAQVARQQEQIEVLVREITQLRRQVPEGRGDGQGTLRDELPPHY